MPHRLWGSKLHQRDAIHPFNTSRVELRSPANSVEVNRPVLFEPGQGLSTHAALADYGAHSVFADDVCLVRLLANARRRSRRRDLPAAVRLLRHHGTAVIDHAAVQIDRWRVARQVMMHGIAPRVCGTADE